MKRIEYHPGARLDVLEIVEYYEQTGGTSVADGFVLELQRYIESVAERPESHPKYVKDVRRANMRRFPYHVLFRVLDQETIKILAIKHNRRHPSFAGDRR
jgi:plasmid stabilization system protein ParE